jgi:hypothetical protein
MTFTEAKRIYEKHGGHFFDNETLIWWNSKVYQDLYSDKYFITSEPDFDGKNRRFTIREFSEDYCSVSTVGEFRQYGTLAEAKSAIKSLLQV